MFKRLNYYWRVFATGLSFTVFGVGGLLLRVMVFPVLNILLRRQSLRVICARNVIRYTFRAFIEFMRLMGVLRYEIHGLERLNGNGRLILANHPTLIDTVYLMAFVKQADCIVKSALWHNPFTRGPVRAANFICNANGPDLIDNCVTVLRNGENLIIFPEGTRTPVHGRMTFKRGAANIAVRSLCSITPVVIRCTPPTLSKGNKWWQVPPVIARFSIEVQEDINVQDFIAGASTETLAARRLNDYLQLYFMQKNHAT